MQTTKDFHTRSALIVVGMAVATALACGRSSPTGPTHAATPTPDPTVFAGTWAGPINDFGIGGGNARLDLVGERGSLSGKWSALIGFRFFSGTLVERRQPDAQIRRFINLQIGCTNDENGGAGTMQLDGSELFVTYLVADCGPGPFGIGTMTLTKQ